MSSQVILYSVFHPLFLADLQESDLNAELKSRNAVYFKGTDKDGHKLCKLQTFILVSDPCSAILFEHKLVEPLLKKNRKKHNDIFGVVYSNMFNR